MKPDLPPLRRGLSGQPLLDYQGFDPEMAQRAAERRAAVQAELARTFRALFLFAMVFAGVLAYMFALFLVGA